MTYEEYCILDYVVYGKYKTAKHFTEKEMCGWLDNYHRYVPNQEEIDKAICSLIDQGLLVQTENTYQASADVKALWKASRYWLGDIFGLADCTRSRFKTNLKKNTGLLQTGNQNMNPPFCKFAPPKLEMHTPQSKKGCICIKIRVSLQQKTSAIGRGFL